MKIPVGNAPRMGQKDWKPTEAPTKRDHLVEKFDNDAAGKVPCPMISILLMEDMITPDKEGNVDVAQLKKALGDMGISALPKHALGNLAASAVGGGFFARQANVFELFGSRLDHEGSLGALQGGGFNQELHDQVKACSSDGVTLSFEDIATAQSVRHGQTEAPLRDRITNKAELSALFLVFGQPRADGQKAISLKDWDTIFVDNKIPDSFKDNPTATGATNLAWQMTKMAFTQNLGTAAARAEKGLRDGLDMPQALSAPDALAGLGAMCPAGMRPKQGMGISEPEIDKLHASLAQQPTDQNLDGAGAS